MIGVRNKLRLVVGVTIEVHHHARQQRAALVIFAEVEQHGFETAIREVREETSIEIETKGIITAVDSLWRDEAGRPRYHYTIVEVLAEWRSGEPVAGDDAEAAAWFAPDAIGPLGLWSETVRVIELGRKMRAGR